MCAGELTVKWLDAQFAGVFLEASRIHQRDSSKTTHIGVMQSSSVVEVEPQRGIVELRACEISGVDQERAGKSRLHDDSVAGVEIDHHELGASPAAEDRRAAQSACNGAGTHFAQHIGFPDGDASYLLPADRAVQIARDRFRLR